LGKGVFTAVYTVIKFIWLQNTYFANHRWDKSSFKERATYCAEIFVSLGWKIAFIAAVDQPGTAIVIIFGYFLGGYFTAYWFAYRPHLPYTEAKRYKNTSSLLMPKWINQLNGFGWAKIYIQFTICFHVSLSLNIMRYTKKLNRFYAHRAPPSSVFLIKSLGKRC
jgi:hypothetical protein